MTDETTLLPCPFCGASGYVAEHNHGYYPTAKHDRDCPMAQMGFPESEFYIKPEFAVKAWNTRAEHGTLTAEQIGEAIERNFMKLCVLDDGKPVEWREDWVCRVGIDYRAIADELNATLGSEREKELEKLAWDMWECLEIYTALSARMEELENDE